MADVGAEALKAERAECAIIHWLETEKGELVDYREGTSPLALLGVELETVPPVLPGTSYGHSYEVVGA